METKKEKWDPVEISEEEYDDLYDKLEDKAIELADKIRLSYSLFLSDSLYPCKYDDKELPKSYQIEEKTGVYSLNHFMSKPCNCQSVNMTTEVICLCETYNDKYYLTTHKVGKCPWKMK